MSDQRSETALPLQPLDGDVVGRIAFGPPVALSELRRFAVQQPVDAAHSIAVLKDTVRRLEAALRLCISAAGAPDAADGCRRVIAIARGNLSDD